jgi:hypothetical protein
VLQSRPSHLMPAMNSFTRPTRLILPPGAAFRPETEPFPRQTPPPFRSGAALDAAGAEFQPAGASLVVAGASLRQMVAPPFVAGAEFRRPGAPMPGTGAALRRSGAAPISCAGAPAAWSAATISHSGHPAPRGAATFQVNVGTTARIAKPADKSVRAPLCPQPFALCSA